MNALAINRRRIAAAIRAKNHIAFDLGGVLVDTERLHFRAHRKALSRVRVDLSLDEYKSLGVSTDPICFYQTLLARRHRDVALAPEVLRMKLSYFDDLLQHYGFPAIQPAVDLVRILSAMGRSLAIVTAEDLPTVETVLDHLSLLTCFAWIIAGTGSGLRNKPAPDLYLRAAQSFGVHPAYCLAIEDSGNGVEAAVRAGFCCVAVPNAFTRSHDFRGAFLVTSFSGLRAVLLEDSDQ